MRVMFIDTVHDVLPERLEAAGFECVDHTQSDLAVVKEQISGFEGLVIRSRIPVNKELIDLANSLKFIARSGSGMENIDVEYAEGKGIKCYNAPEGNANAVGEHALGMLLSLFRNLSNADKEVRDGSWERERNRGMELEGKAIGIIGYGNTGSAFAQKLSGFDTRILVFDKYKSGFGNDRVQERTLEDIQHECNIVSLHVPLTDETKYMVNEEFLSAFTKPVWVINTSRGAVVHTDELVNCMKTGKVVGACLDVLEYEKASLERLEQSPDSLDYLRRSRRTVLTPHIAGWTLESYRKLGLVLAEKILKDFGDGQ